MSELDRDVVSAIAMRLADAERSRPTIRIAGARNLGIAFDGEAWRNQLEPEHPLRRQVAWRALGYDVGRRRHNANREARASDRNDLIVPYMEGQLSAGGSLLTTPVHFSHETVGMSRHNDLRLAVDFCERVLRLDVRRARDDAIPRTIYASMLVDASHLTPFEVRWLVRAYAELADATSGPDGFWIWFANFNESRPRYDLARMLTLALQENTGKVCVVGGLRSLWAAGLTNGFAAVCTGPGRSELKLLPPAPPAEGERTELRRKTHVFHGPVMHKFSLDSKGRRLERRSFQLFGCSCGRHPSRTVPADERERVLHNNWEMMQLARVAASDSASEASQALAARLPRVEERRALVSLKRMKRPWHDAADVGELPGQAHGAQAS